MTEQELLDALTDIAQRNVPSLITLADQQSGRLDFHEIHVTSINDMLHAAYQLGRESTSINDMLHAAYQLGQ